MRQNKDQQWKAVIEGLAVGLLANGVEAVYGSKMNLEFAFQHAWNAWNGARWFPSIAPNLFMIYVNKSQRRTGTRAALEWYRCLTPQLIGGG